MPTTFSVGNHSATDPCLCGEQETVEVVRGNTRVRLCGSCMMFFVARAEGNERNASVPRPPKSKGKTPSRPPTATGSIPPALLLDEGADMPATDGASAIR